VPEDTGVTNPLLSMVAMVASAELHGVMFEGVPDPVSCVVTPSQACKFPEIEAS